MRAGHKIVWTILGIIALLLAGLSFAGYWIGLDVSALLSQLPGIGHPLSILFYTILWPGGRFLFPLLFCTSFFGISLFSAEPVGPAWLVQR